MMNNINLIGMNQIGMNQMGMNQIGMNQMGMNQIGMNQIDMNQIGMNQIDMNMDQTAQHIKNIIQPYENKIRELEEIIKKKDFEIIVLKEKLNNFKNNNMNMMINIIGKNMNKSDYNNKEINVNVISGNNTIIPVNSYLCDKASILREKSNINNDSFLIYDYQVIDENLSIQDNGIYNNSTIRVIDYVYQVIFKPTSGKSYGIDLEGDCPVGALIILFCVKCLRKSETIFKILNGEISFIFNASLLRVSDKTPIKKIFGLGRQIIIMVNDSNNMIGGCS